MVLAASALAGVVTRPSDRPALSAPATAVAVADDRLRDPFCAIAQVSSARMLLLRPTRIEWVLRERGRIAEMANRGAKAPIVITAILPCVDRAQMRLGSQRWSRSVSSE
jgi:hypothetical protein